MNVFDYETCPGDRTPVETAIVAAASSAAIAHGCGEGQVLYIVSPVRFNIIFGASGISAPADTGSFPAGLHRFRIKRAVNTHYRVTNNATGTITAWRGSLT